MGFDSRSPAVARGQSPSTRPRTLEGRLPSWAATTTTDGVRFWVAPAVARRYVVTPRASRRRGRFDDGRRCPRAASADSAAHPRAGASLPVVDVWSAFDRRLIPGTLRSWRRGKKMQRAVFPRFRPLGALSRPRDRQRTIRDERPALGNSSRHPGARVVKKCDVGGEGRPSTISASRGRSRAPDHHNSGTQKKCARERMELD